MSDFENDGLEEIVACVWCETPLSTGYAVNDEFRWPLFDEPSFPLANYAEHGHEPMCDECFESYLCDPPNTCGF
jgi:hypothetical protein